MTRFALRRPVTIFMIAAGLCLLGAISWSRLAVQLLPQLIFPEVQINTGQAGASPEKLERDLVIPIEGEVATLDNVHDIQTRIGAGFANITVAFDHDTNMKFAVLKLQQKMTALENRLGEGTSISVEKFDTAEFASYLMQLSIRGDATLEAIREFAEQHVRQRLEKIDGVVNISIGGAEQRNVTILIDSDRCAALNIPVTLVQQKINAFHRQPEHLGRVISSGRLVDVILMGQMDDLHEIRNLIIQPEGGIKLDDVAEVGYHNAERIQYYRVNGKAGVGIFVQKDNLSNMLAVSNDVLAEIDLLNKDIAEQGYELVVNFNQAQIIQEAIDRLKHLALVGAALAMVVLLLFLRSVRFVSILMVAIPVSLLVTFNLMYSFDLSINILSLCGLALAIGMLVDNGIVVMENIFLHRQSGDDPNDAALLGTKEVGRSILAATVTTVLVFLPVLFIESDAQLIIRELALSVIFPLLVSLLVALTLIPLLARYALKNAKIKQFKSGRILEIYRLMLKSAIRHRVRCVSLVIAFLLISLFVGVVFIVQQGSASPPDRLEVYLTMPPGSTLEAADKVVRRIEEQLLELPDLDELRANVRAEEASVTAEFLPHPERTEELKLEQLKENVERLSRRFEKVEVAFEQTNRRGGRGPGGDGLSGLLDTPKGFSLKGQDLRALRSISEQIIQTLKTVPELNRRSVRSDLADGAPELQIHGDRLDLALAGLDMQRIMTAIWATRPGASNASTPFPLADRDVAISLQLLDAETRDFKDIEEMKVQNNVGQLIPLRQVAKIRIDTGPGNIIRHNQEREVQVTYSFTTEAKQSESKMALAKAQIDRLVHGIHLPKGFTLEENQDENEQRVYYWMIGIGAILIFMFLAAQFESLTMPVVILGTVPTATIGALFALTLTGTPLSLGAGAPMALLGLIVLLGIVVNNGIILLDRIAILRNEYGYRWQRAVMVAGQNRVRPIIMTSATTILGLFPLALKQNTQYELWPPFAITVLGGLMVSSFSTLVFIPVLYVGMEQMVAWLKKIGAVWVGLMSLLTIWFLYWYYQDTGSILYTALLALPVWFGLLGVTYAVKEFIAIRHEKKRLSEETLEICIRNLTKIYGSPGRFMREWNKQKRRWSAIVGDGKLPWDKKDLKESAIWLTALGAPLLYLHFFIENAYWLVLLAALTLAWLMSMQELRYRLRFIKGKPPAWRKTTFKMPFKKAKKADPVEHPNGRVTPLSFPRRERALMVMGFVLYLGMRLVPDSKVLLAFVLVVTLIVILLRRISGKIVKGIIDPDQPIGRLRRFKRGIYTIVRTLPGIRPPKKEVVALHGVSLTIGKGMFGLLGPNGAGKTTLMRILVGVLDENRGSIKINGLDLSEHRETFHGAIGYLPQDFGLYESMTPLEYLNYHALTNAIYESDGREELIARIVRSVGLWERRNDKIKTFSGGMKQRVGIAQTLLHLPQIVVVDEPTAGLDPRERIRFRNLLSELAKDRIVIFSTHIVEDISSTCHDLAVLKQGQLVYRGSPEEMQRRATGKVFETTVPEEDFSAWQAKFKVVQHSKAATGIKVRFLSDQPPADSSAHTVEPTLEEAYVYLLGSETR